MFLDTLRSSQKQGLLFYYLLKKFFFTKRLTVIF